MVAPSNRGVGAICNELLESPFLGQFADDNNQELISQSELTSEQSEYANSERKPSHRKKNRHDKHGERREHRDKRPR